MLSLDHHYLTLSLPLKVEFCLDSFSSVYSHLVLNAHITTGMVNKDTYSREHTRRILFPFCVVDTTWRPRDIIICRHHMSLQKMILLELLLLHSIIIDCIYLIGLTATLSKLTGSTFGPFTVGHCLVISLHLQIPCTD